MLGIFLFTHNKKVLQKLAYARICNAFLKFLLGCHPACPPLEETCFRACPEFSSGIFVAEKLVFLVLQEMLWVKFQFSTME